MRSVAGGWRLAFEPKDMVQSQTYLNGNDWADWLASTCPALLIRGAIAGLRRKSMSKKWRSEDLTRGFVFCRVVTSFTSTTRRASMQPCQHFWNNSLRELG